MEPRIPHRSWQRIMGAIFALDDRTGYVDRDFIVETVSLVTATNRVCDQSVIRIRTNLINNTRVDEELEIEYRDGLFYKAVVNGSSGKHIIYRLSEVLRYLSHHEFPDAKVVAQP